RWHRALRRTVRAVSRLFEPLTRTFRAPRVITVTVALLLNVNPLPAPSIKRSTSQPRLQQRMASTEQALPVNQSGQDPTVADASPNTSPNTPVDTAVSTSQSALVESDLLSIEADVNPLIKLVESSLTYRQTDTDSAIGDVQVL